MLPKTGCVIPLSQGTKQSHFSRHCERSAAISFNAEIATSEIPHRNDANFLTFLRRLSSIFGENLRKKHFLVII